MLLQSSANWWIVCGLAYRSLGIIYGDIGTSPLCACSHPSNVRR